MSNISSLKRQAEILLAKLENGKFYQIADLNDRLQKTASDYPQDTVIKAVSCVVENMCNKNPNQIISQGDFEKLYNQLVGLNASGTRFREILGDLLLTGEPTKPVMPNKEFVEGHRDGVEASLEYEVDPEVKRDFDNLFVPAEEKYNPLCAAKAKEKINLELKSMGCDASHIRFVGGNSKLLVFAADFETRRGIVPVFIPADASGEKFPSVFVAGNRFVSLTPSNLRTHVEASVVETTNISKPINEIILPPTPVPEPLRALTSEVEESVLEATVGYPQASVRLAKRMVLMELSSMGFKGSQVRVSSATQDGFICEATLNTPRGKVAVEVPIEMQRNVPLMPAVFAKGDFIDEFTAQKLHSFATKEMPLTLSFVRRDSPLLDMDIHQLKDVIAKSAAQEDYDTCDEVLEAVAQSFDEDTYRNVVADYHKMLLNFGNAKESLAQTYDDSNQFVHSPNSMYPIHKKLGRPARDLVRDENGEYHLKSTYYARKNQAEEGAFFSNAKVLCGDE